MTELLYPPTASKLDLDGTFLRGYQKAAVRCVAEGEAAGHSHQIVQKPCGAGKTITGLAVVRRRGRGIWLAHREELITQPIADLVQLWPGAEYGVVQAKDNAFYAKDIVFASVQSMVRRLDLPWRPFEVCVVDEAHHAASPTYRKILEFLLRLNSRMLVVGLTATPTRADGKNLSVAGFTAFAYRMTIDEAIRHGYLVPYEVDRIVLPKLDLSKVAVLKKTKDYDPKQLDEALRAAHASEEVAKVVVEKCLPRRTVVFCASVRQAEETHAELVKRGVAAVWVCGDKKKTSNAARKQAIEDVKSGKARVIVNALVLTEGTDIPALEVAVIARPTRSRGLLIQECGRVLRNYPGKTRATIFDTVGAVKVSGLRMVGHLSRPNTEEEEAEETKGLEVLGSFAEDNPAPKEPPQKIEGEIVGRFLDEATEGKTQRVISASRAFWIEITSELHVLPLGEDNRFVALLKDGKSWRAEVGVQKLMDGPDAELVQGVAEDYARSLGALGLTEHSARWRSKDPSPGHLSLMRRYGVFHADGCMTAGEASDAIVAAVARQRYHHKVREAYL